MNNYEYIKAVIDENIFSRLNNLWPNFENNITSIIDLIKKPVSSIVNVQEDSLTFCPFINNKEYINNSFFVYWNKPKSGGAGVYLKDALYISKTK